MQYRQAIVRVVGDLGGPGAQVRSCGSSLDDVLPGPNPGLSLWNVAVVPAARPE